MTTTKFLVNHSINPSCRLRKSKSQPASASLFEWALTHEQEREAELVEAGP